MHKEVKNDGFTSNGIFSQLGERWRKVTPAEKRRYGMKAEFLKAINSDPEKLERTSTVNKFAPDPIPHNLLRSKSV